MIAVAGPGVAYAGPGLLDGQGLRSRVSLLEPSELSSLPWLDCKPCLRSLQKRKPKAITVS